MTDSTIRDVSDTAIWVAHYRAVETARPDALFRDPFAARLAGPRGAAIDAGLQDGRTIAKAIVVRTVTIDALVEEAVNVRKVDMVINFAAGLDSRPWRMQLPASLHWVDVDLPGILDYKLRVLANDAPVCRYEAVRADLTQPGVLQDTVTRLGAAGKSVLVITEGLLVYLKADQVAAIGRAFHSAPSFQWWISDLAGPLLMRYIARAHGKALQNAPFQFAPAEGTAFFEPLGWKEVLFKSTGHEARRLGRPMPRDWLFRILSFITPKEKLREFERMSGVVLFQRI